MSKKTRSAFSIALFIGLCMISIGVMGVGITYYIENKDVIKIRSSENLIADDAPEENPPVLKAETDPLKSLMVFQSDLADASSVKIICQPHHIPGADLYRPLASWAKRQGFHAIMFGNVLSFNNRIVLTGPENLDMEAVCKRLQKLGITRAVSFAINSQSLELPYPFEFTSLGHVSFEKETVKKAFIWPTKKKKSKMISANMLVEIIDGDARVYSNGRPFEGIPTGVPIKKFQ
jgi:hypothetical protein